MNRLINLSILIAVIFAALVNWNSAYASTPVKTEVHNVFIATFDNGQFYGAMLHFDGDSYAPIAFVAGIDENETPTFEDMLPSNGNTITATFELDERGYNGIMHAYSTEYGKMLDFSWRNLDDSDIGTIANVDTSGSITYGTVNGDQAQFTGFVTNGSMYLLREADAYSTHGTGWIVQNGNLISYVVSNGEENSNQAQHKVYITLVLR